MIYHHFLYSSEAFFPYFMKRIKIADRISSFKTHVYQRNLNFFIEFQGLFDPEVKDALQLGPHVLPVGRFEIERINVLVLLRRILGILNRAVRPIAKPIRMFLHIGMVGGTLKGNVQGDLDPPLAGCVNQPSEIVERAKLRVNGFVPALLRTDSPRAAHVVHLSLGSVVLSFSECLADGMNRRQIQHIKSHFGNVRQPCLDIFQRPVHSWLRRARPREHFVPRTEASPLAIDGDLQLPLVLGREFAIRITLHERQQFGVLADLCDASERILIAQPRYPCFENPNVRRVGPLDSRGTS